MVQEEESENSLLLSFPLLYGRGDDIWIRLSIDQHPAAHTGVSRLYVNLQRILYEKG